MCPFYNPSTAECKVTPASDARQDGSYKDHYCTGGNYTSCGNYQAYQRGDYIIRRQSFNDDKKLERVNNMSVLSDYREEKKRLEMEHSDTQCIQL